MTNEQKNYKLLILADIHIAKKMYNSENKYYRLTAAYHTQQAIEKTIKLKAEIKGLNLWGHDIKKLVTMCDTYGIDINIPKLIRQNANRYTKWEANCRYYPTTVVRRDTIFNAIRVVEGWLNSGDTLK